MSRLKAKIEELAAIYREKKDNDENVLCVRLNSETGQRDLFVAGIPLHIAASIVLNMKEEEKIARIILMAAGAYKALELTGEVKKISKDSPIVPLDDILNAVKE